MNTTSMLHLNLNDVENKTINYDKKWRKCAITYTLPAITRKTPSTRNNALDTEYPQKRTRHRVPATTR